MGRRHSGLERTHAPGARHRPIDVAENVSEPQILFQGPGKIGVNHGGPGATAGWLQIALNACNTEGSLYPDIAEDGDIGDETLGALRSLIKSARRDVDRLLASMCNILQGAHYIGLSRERKKDERFVQGWIERRVMADFELISRTGDDSVDSDSSTGPR